MPNSQDMFWLEMENSRLMAENKKLRMVLAALCPRCGRLSWDVPLEDYCQCEPNQKDLVRLLKQAMES